MDNGLDPKWTRTTASHKKSSAVLDKAKTDLLSCLDKITKSLESSTKEITSCTRQTIIRNTSPLFQGLEDLTGKYHDQLKHTILRLHNNETKLLHHYRDLIIQTQKMITKLTNKESSSLHELSLEVKKCTLNQELLTEQAQSLKDSVVSQVSFGHQRRWQHDALSNAPSIGNET